jgi:hypothetical protein
MQVACSETGYPSSQKIDDKKKEVEKHYLVKPKSLQNS